MMIARENFKKINDWLWEVEKTKHMRVPARIYVSEKMLDEVFKDRSVEQLVNTATLPGIINYSMAMPDIHEGYGFPIGGVAAMDKENGVISPGGVGYDINCGMRLLKSELSEKDISPYLDKLALEMQKEVPSGLGKGRQVKLSIDNLDKILKHGAKKLVEQGFGEEDDIKNCESNGFIEQADPLAVSEHAKNRGRDQVGTLGSGNHFLEVQKVDEIFDQEIAQKFGLFKNQVVVMIHTGSRGLGHQIATDYIQVMMKAMPKYDINLPDRELACAPFKSKEGQRYFVAMSAGANYAWANRQMIAHYIRKAWKEILGEKTKLTAIYDVAHNIAKLEKYKFDGKEMELVVHRKGATRAFPEQPVLIPGSMGTASYVLIGTEQGKDSWYSTCHGAGRTMSRSAATRSLSGQEIINQLKAKGILVKCYSMRGIAEEAPQAYKNIDEVVEVVHQAGLSKKVARLVPLAVIKGE
jgi:tRNA-splicing ligase RtcB